MINILLLTNPTDFLSKLIVTHLCSHNYAIEPYPEPVQFSPQLYPIFIQDPF
jgi:hypothetical protein